MISTSQAYKSIIAGRHSYEWKIQLGNGTEFGEEYIVKGIDSSESTLRIIRNTFSSNEPSLGNCIAAEFTAVLRLASYRIPRRTEIKPFFRAVPEVGEPSDWYQAGVFFVDSRHYDPDTGTLTINCIDAMLKADGHGGSTYYDLTSITSWPASVTTVVEEIAQLIGVEIDNRTVLQSGFLVDDPGDLTMREVLGYIAVPHGGSWVITSAGKLRLVPLRGDSTDTVELGLSSVSLEVEPEYPSYTKVSLVKDNKTTYTSGIAVGLHITAEDPWATQAKAEFLRTALEHVSYQPFTVTEAFIDPAVELGDRISFTSGDDDLHSFVWSLDLSCDSYALSTVAAPGGDEMNHEYPYIPSYKKRQRRVEEEIEDLEESVDEKIEETKDEIIDEVTEEIVPEEVGTAITQTLIRAKLMNFAGWNYGSFYEVLDNDDTVNYSVYFDAQNRPILITDGDHSCQIVW